MLALGLVIAFLYVAYSSGALTPLGVAPPAPGTNLFGAGGVSTPAPSVPAAVAVTPNFGAAQTNQFAAIQASNVALNAIPVVGPALAAVAGALTASLQAASKKRAQEAVTENAQLQVSVPGFDQAMAQVNALYTTRQIDAQTAIAAVQAIYQNFWAEMIPKIQPGRNGCNGGANCPVKPSCSGSIGAACCVGCYDLAGSDTPFAFTTAQGGDGTPMYFGVKGTIVVLQHGGGAPVLYQMVDASKYGGVKRPPYILNWTQVAES
jgi:hypothetical protein